MKKHTVGFELCGRWLWVEMSKDGKGLVDIKSKSGVSYFEQLKPAHHIILAKALQVIGEAEKPMEDLV